MRAVAGSFGSALVAPAAFGAAVVVLLAAGRGELAAPPVGDLGGWLEARGPITASVAALRLLALAAAGWMFVVSAAATLARLIGAARLASTLDAAVPTPLRRALTGVAGAGTAGAVLLGITGSPTPGAASLPVPVEQLERLAEVPATETMTVLPPEVPASASTPAEAPTPAPTEAPAPVPLSEDAPEEWLVAPGDSFWSIAEDLVATDLGRPPSDTEVVPYWHTLIEANRDRLVSSDPDLIFPGQALLLPAGGTAQGVRRVRG